MQRKSCFFGGGMVLLSLLAFGGCSDEASTNFSLDGDSDAADGEDLDNAMPDGDAVDGDGDPADGDIHQDGDVDEDEEFSPRRSPTRLSIRGKPFATTPSPRRPAPPLARPLPGRTPNTKATSRATGSPASDGSVPPAISTLQPGWHTVTLIVTNPGLCCATHSISVGICTLGTPETFDTNIEGSGWRVYGDAFWHYAGYPELTDNLQGKKGAVFNIMDLVPPGNVSISFDISTGPNMGTGADGFAMSVFNAASVEELEAIIDDALPGGGLAYGVSGDYGPYEVEAFHVEIDTWHNVDNGDTQLHTDPTPENHIAVTMNCDPEEHLLWTEVPNIEDLRWHTVTVNVIGITVIVTLDGVEIINGDVVGLEYKGGLHRLQRVDGPLHELSPIRQPTAPARVPGSLGIRRWLSVSRAGPLRRTN